MPAASAFGSDSTHVRPTRRGRTCCVAFLAARWYGQTAPGPRAGAGRLQRLETATVIRSQKLPQAASPCSWTCRRLPAHSLHSERNEAPKPPARGAWAREYGAEGTGRRHCRPEGTGRRHCRPGLAGKGGEAGADAFVDAAGHALHVGVFFVFRLLVRGDGEVDQGFFVLLPVQQHQPE